MNGWKKYAVIGVVVLIVMYVVFHNAKARAVVTGAGA